MSPELLTPAQTAEFLKISVSSLRHWRYSGKGPPVVQLAPGTFRYPLSALLAYINSRTLTPCGRKENENVAV